MADKIDLHIVYRRKGSASASFCAITDRNEWGSHCNHNLLPPLQHAALSPEGDHFVLHDATFTSSVIIQPGVQTYVVLEDLTESPGKYRPIFFTSDTHETAAMKAKEYLQKSREPEVTTPGPRVPIGQIMEIEAGGHQSVGKETPFDIMGLYGPVHIEGEEDAFRGQGYDLGVRVFFPRLRWGKYISWVNLSVQGSKTSGKANDHYTSISGDPGDWATWRAGLFLGLQLDAQFFASATADQLLPWNIFFRYDTPLAAWLGFHARAALNGRSLPEEDPHFFDYTEVMTPFADSHRISAGGGYCLTEWFCINSAAFYHWQEFNHGEVHFGQKDFGIVLALSFFNYTAEEPATVGDTYVVMEEAPFPPPKQ